MQNKKGGLKHDTGKPDFTLISRELLEEVAAVRAFGAKKYAKNNWKKGFKVTRSLAAALRHIYSFLSGETLDQESGLSHLAHAVCCLEHAIYDMKHHPENDDRDDNPSEGFEANALVVQYAGESVQWPHDTKQRKNKWVAP